MPWVSLGSSRVAGFTWLRPRCGRVHPRALGSLGCALGVVGFIRGRWVHFGAPRWSLSASGVRPGCRRVQLRSLGSLRCALGFMRFILVHWGSSRGSSGVSAVAGFTRVRRSHGSRHIVRMRKNLKRGRRKGKETVSQCSGEKMQCMRACVGCSKPLFPFLMPENPLRGFMQWLCHCIISAISEDDL